MNSFESDQTVAKFIVDELHEFGVTDIFCVLGGAIAPISETFATDSRFNIHYLLHEQSAGIAAESFASVGGKPAVLLVTSGPGSTNAMTPLVASWTNSSPLIVIAGQVRSQDVEKSQQNRQWGSQHIDSIAMVKPFTKVARRIDRETVAAHLKLDLQASTGDRPGPIWLEVSVDVQKSRVRKVYSAKKSVEVGDNSSIDEFIQLLEKAIKIAEKPLILLGNGCRSELPRVIELVESLKIPFQLTWPALDFLPVDHNLYAGRPGSISTWGANLTTQSADMVLVLGARLDWGQVAFSPENFAPLARIFRVEIDPEELRRIPAARIVDAATSIKNFLDCVEKSDFVKSAVEKDISAWKNKVYALNTELAEFGSNKPTSDISMYDFLSVLSRNSSKFNTVVSGSSGTCTEQVMQAIAPSPGQRVLNSGGLGSMGFGIAGAIGAYFATGEPVLCLESDGSFAMNPQDIQFIASNKLPIRIVIMDSKGYKSILLSQRRGNYSQVGIDDESGLGLLDSVAVAQSMGLPATSADISSDWQNLLIQFLSETSPSLLRLVVGKDEEAAPRVISKPNKEGQIQTTKLDELWPELYRNQKNKHLE